MIRIFLCAIYLSCWVLSFSQDNDNYSPLSTVFPGIDSIEQVLSKIKDADILKSPKEYREEFEDTYEKGLEYELRLINNGLILYDKDLYAYVQNIFNQIIQNNPVLQGGVTVFLLRHFLGLMQHHLGMVLL